MQPPGYPPNPYGQPQYGAPPQQQPQYGQPPYQAQMYGPPPGAPKKKSMVGWIIGGIAAVVLLGVGATVGIYAYMQHKRGSLPIEATKLPSQTRELETRLIPAAREPNERIKKIYLASELASAFCSGHHDPASRLESIGLWGSKSAKEFFDPANLDNVRATLECGTQLASALDDVHASYLTFDGEEDKSGSSSTGSTTGSGSSGPPLQYVAIGHFNMKNLPTAEGYTSVSFGSISGYCQTTAPAYATSSSAALLAASAGADAGAPGTSTTKTCDDKSRAAFAVGSTWFFGEKSALDTLSKGMLVPKSTLGTRVAAMQDAFNQTSGLPEVGLVAEPKSSKEYLEYPCEFAASQLGIHYYSSSSSSTSSGSLGALGSTTGSATDTGAIKSRDDFMQACFPSKQDSKLIEEIDAKLRAIAFETDPDYVESGSVAGNLVLVTRDAESAKDAERSIRELVSDWKSQIELNAPKLIKAGKDQASTTRQRKFSAVADTYFQALSLMKVTTAGRTVKISFKAAFTKEDQQELKDEDKTSDDKRLPVAEILEAIRDKKPIPQASLAKIVGASWAAYLVLPPLAPAGPSPKVKLTTDECNAMQAKLKLIKMSDLPSGTDATKNYIDQRFALCDYKPPEVTEVQRKCLATFVSASDYAACMGGDSVDPRMPPETDFGKLK